MDFFVCFLVNFQDPELIFSSSLLVFLGEDLLASLFHGGYKIHSLIFTFLVHSPLNPSSGVTSSQKSSLKPIIQVTLLISYKPPPPYLIFSNVCFHCLSPFVKCMFCEDSPPISCLWIYFWLLEKYLKDSKYLCLVVMVFPLHYIFIVSISVFDIFM